MPLLAHDGALLADPWVQPGDGPVPPGAAVIVALDRWTRARDDITRLAGRVGILLASDQPPSLIAESLDGIALVALDFPRFTDGRAYSYARQLRGQYGFRGELRAVGNVLRDQLDFMRRCGFDSFALPDGADAAEWRRALGAIPLRAPLPAGPSAAGTLEAPAGCWAY